jgi:hypothetical protein
MASHKKVLGVDSSAAMKNGIISNAYRIRV